MGKKKVPTEILAAIRSGCSLFSACQKAGVSTADFYQILMEDEKIRREYQLALSDYADQCTDEIKAIAAALKAGEIDNSTAKLLIETEKWLVQKFCTNTVWDVSAESGTDGGTAEIVVKFV